MTKKSLWTLLLCFAIYTIQAQSDFFKNPPIIISIYSHSVGMPFKTLVKQPLNLGVAIGTEFTYKQKDKRSLHQKIEIGWYNHENLNTAFWVKADLVSRYKITGNWYVETQAGLGYIHDFNAYETFELQEGQYRKINNASKGGLIAAFGLGTSYSLEMNEKYTLSPFLRYEGWLQFPHSELAPVFPHTLLHLGTRFQMNE